MAKEKWRALTNPKKEKHFKRVEIECLNPEDEEDFVLCASPMTKEEAPGKTQKSPPYTWTNPIKKSFKTIDELVDYLKEEIW